MSDNLTYRALKNKFGAAISKTLCVVGCLLGTSVLSVEIRILSFNLQNLFDSKHDPGKSDWAFLPRSLKRDPLVFEECLKVRGKKWKNECFFQDWTEKSVEKKIRALAKVLDPKKLGFLPDLLLFQEVENEAVLKRLQKSLGLYPHLVHVEGPDPRGIEVAILSRWPLIQNAKVHATSPQARQILEASFEVSGQRLTVLAVHLPSAGNPRIRRVENLRLLNRLALQIPESQLLIAGGDFNITRVEESKWNLLETLIFPQWRVPHQQDLNPNVGSFWDKSAKKWNKFDLFLVRKSSGKHWSLSPQIHQISERPKAFDPATGLGVSDHFPVSLLLRESLSLGAAERSGTSPSSSRKILNRVINLGLWEAIQAKLKNFRILATEKAKSQ